MVIGRRSVAARESEQRRNLLDASFASRLVVVESLIEKADMRTSVAFDDVLRVVLDAAVEVSGAASGAVDFLEAQGEELAVTLHEETDATPRRKDNTLHLSLGADGDEAVGTLTLTFDDADQHPDEVLLEALRSFCRRAGGTLTKARTLDVKRSSAAYLQAADLVKSRFLTTISHELRTPLTSVIGYAKTLSVHWERLPDGQKQEFVRQIEAQGARLSRLVERILEAARVELEGIEIKPVLHDVRLSVEKAAAPFMMVDGDRIALALPDGPLDAEIDPFVIDQVVSNLIDNALRYTSEEVRVSVDGYRSSITIAVSDKGAGIDPKQLNLVLEPLYRIDENVNSGTGLGLHIVRTLVEAHGGRGEIRSGPTGTSIAIKLPRSTGGQLSKRVAHPAHARRPA